jgi:hypothetical protein
LTALIGSVKFFKMPYCLVSMIEVFKTDVDDRTHATILLGRIHETFHSYTANFDLQDCDRILRVKSKNGYVAVPRLIEFLNQWGCRAEPLPD